MMDLSVAMLERRLEGLDKKLDLSVVNLEYKYDLLNQKVDSGMNRLSSLMLDLGAAVLCGFSIIGYLIKL